MSNHRRWREQLRGLAELGKSFSQVKTVLACCNWGRLLSVGLHLVLLAGAVFFTLSKLTDFFQTDGSVWSGAVQVRRIYLAQADYIEYIPTIARLNPGVAFSVAPDGKGLLLSVADEQLFPDLMMGLNSLQAFKPSIAWDLEELCVKKCGDDIVAKILVQGFTQEMR